MHWSEKLNLICSSRFCLLVDGGTMFIGWALCDTCNDQEVLKSGLRVLSIYQKLLLCIFYSWLIVVCTSVYACTSPYIHMHNPIYVHMHKPYVHMHKPIRTHVRMHKPICTHVRIKPMYKHMYACTSLYVHMYARTSLIRTHVRTHKAYTYTCTHAQAI